jgi:four helix bundle protein
VDKKESRYSYESGSSLQGHKNLDVWKVAMRLAVDIYEVTNAFPGHEKFGMVQQMRKSAVSVPSNIAEGAGRLSKGEFVRFLGIARGSLSELDTQVELSRALDYLPDRDNGQLFQRIDRVGSMLNGLIGKLRRDIES